MMRKRWTVLFILVLAVLTGIAFARDTRAEQGAVTSGNAAVSSADAATAAASTTQAVSGDASKDASKDAEKITKGWNKSKTSYYVKGRKVKGLKSIDGKLYLFDRKGKLFEYRGKKKIGKKYYFFDSDHSLKTGAVKVGKKKYEYYSTSEGTQYRKNGMRKIEGKKYSLDSSFRLKRGWQRYNGSRYYFGKDCSAYTGWNYVGKYKYYFTKSGKLKQDVRKLVKVDLDSDVLIKVNRTACVTTVYAKDWGKKARSGYVVPVVAFICSPGHHTPVGTFKINDKLRWHELDGPCWGQWCEHLTSEVLFHSVFYNSQNNNRTLSTRAYNQLGTMASHGCVRLAAGDAYWINQNVKIGTKVIIYNNKKNPGPFDKPKKVPLKPGTTYDPTDPTIKENK